MLAAQPDRKLWVQSGDTHRLQSADDEVTFATIHVWANATVTTSGDSTTIAFDLPAAVAARADRFVLVPVDDSSVPWIDGDERIFSVATARLSGVSGLHIVAAEGSRSPSPTYVHRGHPSLQIAIP